MSVRFLLVLACLCTLPLSALEEPDLYSVSSVNLTVIDRATGTREVIPLDPPITGPLLSGPTDVAFAPDGSLLVFTELDHRLLAIDTETGTVELLGVFDVSGEFDAEDVLVRGLTVDACGRIFVSTLWARDLDEPFRLWQVDPVSGTSHLLGGVPWAIGALAARGEQIVAYSDSLFGEFGEFKVLLIDPVTLEADEIPLDCSGCRFHGLDTDQNGDLWMIPPPPGVPSPPSRPMVSVDLETGEVESYGLTSGEWFAIAPAGGICLSGSPLVIPTVSPFGLVGLVGLLMLAGVWVSVRRRSRA